MVGFTKKKVNTQTIGERLREIRKEAGVSLDEIARSTKVRKIYLEKIEADQFDELPPDVYVKGFLSSYAKYLEINPKDVIRLYQKERGIRKSIKKLQLPSKSQRKFKMPAITITPKVFASVLAGLVVLAGVFYFYREIDHFAATPRLVIKQPTGDISIEGSAVEVQGITDKENKLFINEQPIFVDQEGRFSERVGLQAGINELEIKAVNHFEKETVRKIKVSADYENQLAQSEEGNKVMGDQSAGKIKLEIRVEENPTWISVEIDNQHTQSGTMLPGSIQIFEADEKISVTSGKANRTIIKLNDEELGALNDSAGVIRDVVFTRDTRIIPEPEPEEEPISD